MEQEERESREQAGWQLKAQRSMMILEQLQAAGVQYAEGEIPKWFWCLSAVRELVNMDLKPNEVIELDEKEAFIKKGLSIWNKYVSMKEDGDIIKKSMRKNVKTFTNAITKYQRRLMDLLKAMGYFPKKEDKSELNF